MEENNEKKERVMHTRIPESLDKQLKHKAQGLGVSVSNLVRNVLTNTFDLVDDIVSDSADIARFAASDTRETIETRQHNPIQPKQSNAIQDQTERETLINEPLIRETLIHGWQPLVLNLNAICHQCNAILPKGSDAAIGICTLPAVNTTPPCLCTQCLKDLSHEPGTNNG